MNSNRLLWLALTLCTAFTFSSCDKDEIDDPVIPNEEEVITTLNLTLSPLASGPDVTFSFQDIDGDGPLEPTIEVSDTLMANSQYAVSLLLLNETVTPADTVNVEILDEADEHQFFFIIEGLDLTNAYADSDANGDPIGLSNIMSTGQESTGTIQVVLRHEPDKDASGVVEGDISNAGGETDIEATFDVSIQ